MEIEFFYSFVSNCMINGIGLATTYFLYIFLKKFINKKRDLIACVTYLVLIIFFYYIPPIIPNLVEYSIAMSVVFLILIVKDMSRIKLKAFLCVTYFVLRWLALGSVSQLMMLFNQLTNNIGSLNSSILMINITFVLTQALEFVLCVLFLDFSVKMFLKVYNNCYEELPAKEFLMLLMPMLAQVVAYQSVINYYNLYDKAMRAEVIAPVYEFNYTLLIFFIISYVAILSFLTFYQQLKVARQNSNEQQILASQIQQLKEHIVMVEKAYDEVRAIRHDMSNHLMILNNLIEKGEHNLAEEYSVKVSKALAETKSDIQSGNPVTDIVIREYKAKFLKNEIAFESDFHYPNSEKIDVFDMSIVLFNALQNAFEASSRQTQVCLKSFRNKNTFIIELSNSCSKNIIINEATGLPITSKSDTTKHGYGLKNIKRIARKYNGDIKISIKNSRFVLNIMMMLE